MEALYGSTWIASFSIVLGMQGISHDGGLRRKSGGVIAQNIGHVSVKTFHWKLFIGNFLLETLHWRLPRKRRDCAHEWQAFVSEFISYFQFNCFRLFRVILVILVLIAGSIRCLQCSTVRKLCTGNLLRELSLSPLVTARKLHNRRFSPIFTDSNSRCLGDLK